MNVNNGTTLRQPRFGYFPILGLVLTNFLTNSVIAKLAALGSLRLGSDSTPLLHGNVHQHRDQPYWNAVSNPYGPPPPTTSIIEAIAGHYEQPSYETQHVHHHHHHVPSLTQQQIVHIKERPTEIIINGGDNETSFQAGEVEGTTSNAPLLFDVESECYGCNTNLEKPNFDDTFVGESRNLLSIELSNQDETSKVAKRSTSYNNKNNNRRYTNVRKNNKYIVQRRRPQRPFYPDYFYDYAEDRFYNKYNNYRRRKPTRRPVDSYDDSDLDDDSFAEEEESFESEELSNPKKKQQTSKTKKKSKLKQKHIKEDSDEDISEVEDESESVKIKDIQAFLRQQNTTIITNITTTMESPTSTESTTSAGYGKMLILSTPMSFFL